MLPRSDQYVNIHAHRRSANDREWVLTSMFAQDYPPEDPGSGHFSVGIHPWHLFRFDTNEQLESVRIALEDPHVLAVGEAGLDTLAEAPMELQRSVFESQVELAQYANVAVIIHAVKTYHHFPEFVKNSQPTAPMIIHGYRGSAQMAADLVDAGFYLSFGEPLLRRDRKTETLMRSVPLESLFLETDESDTPIEEIYQAAAGLLQMEVPALMEAMAANARTCFGS